MSFLFSACRHFLAGFMSFLLLYNSQKDTISISVGLWRHQHRVAVPHPNTARGIGMSFLARGEEAA